jgi:hypothetical protein
MSIINFAGMKMFAPTGWSDESTIVLTKPNSISDPRLGAIARDSGRPEASLTVKWEKMPRNRDLERYLIERLDELKRALPTLTVIDSGLSVEGARDVAFLELQMEEPLPLRQIVLARGIGDLVVVVTGSALPGIYTKLKNVFVEAIASVSAE